MRLKFWCKLVVVALGAVGSVTAVAQDEDGDVENTAGYEKSTEGAELVKNKLYPKQKRLELGGGIGFILNQSYVDTALINAGLTYFFSEEWGVGLDVAIGSNSDKAERECIELFYNDPNDEVGAPCGPSDNLTGKANYGPAYVPIREIQNIISINAQWSPVYGKQLILLSSTSYFDLFLEGGLGLASSVFYPKQEVLRNGKVSRGTFEENGDEPPGGLGAKVDETFAYGEAGRPDPEDQNNILINLGVGQRFHFGKRFQLRMALRNMTLLGTPTGFENLFALLLGAGVRF